MKRAACRSPSAAMPAAWRIAADAAPDIDWFFGEKASIDGGIVAIFEGSRSLQAKASREKT